ncbi:lysM domain receptor-like kinase 4 [Rhododendron vialii]|uniref:lysM domain receptor-like kinase 4 n=1 Tax=Rhododendron vialii TaxID=182163 RepID=UPI00265F0900|nr:lysM domain receptor-like kinase 4 [Rhododendron vialii]
MDVPPLLIFSLFFFFFLISPPCLIHAQQPYVGKATTACGTTGNSNTVVGYTCNGLNTAYQAYITFRSQSPYNTVSSISQLLNSDPSRVSRINSVPDYSSIIALAPSPEPPPSPASEPSSNTPWVYAVVGVIGGVGVLLVIGSIAFWLFIRGRNIRREGFQVI